MAHGLKRFLRWQNLTIHVQENFHSVECSSGVNSRHKHEDFLELVFVRSGHAVHVVDSQEIPVEPGNIFLIRENCEHFYDRAQEMEIYNILLDRAFLDYFSEDMQSLPNYQLLFNLDRAVEKNVLKLENRYFPEVIKILEDIISEEENETPGARTAVLGEVLRLFVFLFRHAEPVVEKGRSNSTHAYKISLLLAAIDQRYHEDWNLEKMAAFVKMSPMNFRLEFKRLTGISPVNYLLKTRLAKASLMLILPHKTIAETALSCGFHDSNYFTRQFHHEFKVTPREYRNLHS